MIVGGGEAAFGEDLEKIVGELTKKCGRESREWWWRQIKSIYRLYLQSVAEYLRLTLVFT